MIEACIHIIRECAKGIEMSGKQLFSLVPRTGLLIAAKVASLWVTLLAGVSFVFTLISYLAIPISAITEGGRPRIGVSASIAKGGAQPHIRNFPYVPGGISVFIELFVLIVIVGYLAYRLSCYFAGKIDERVHLHLYEDLYAHMLDLGKCRGVGEYEDEFSFAMDEGIRDVRCLYSVVVPEVVFSYVALLTLFVVVLCIDAPTALPLLVCLVLLAGLGLLSLKSPKLQRRKGLTMVLTVLCLCCAFVAVALILIRRYIDGHVGLSDALTVQLLCAGLLMPVRRLGTVSSMLQEGLRCLRKITNLLDVNVSSIGVAERRLGFGSCSVIFDDVSRRRTDSVEVTGLSFKAEPGRLTVLLGDRASGAGIVPQLLAGTLEDYQGSILLRTGIASSADLELRSLTLPSLASAVTVVGEGSRFFAGTLRDNLAVADPNASANDMWLALNRAHIDGFVYTQTKGLDMPIESNADNITAGQRLRLFLARALLCDTPVYVFDDVMAGVDSQSAKVMDRAIHELARTKTVIVFTKDADDAWEGDQVLTLSENGVQTGDESQDITRNTEDVSQADLKERRSVSHDHTGIAAVGDAGVPVQAGADRARHMKSLHLVNCVCEVLERLAGVFAPFFAVATFIVRNGQSVCGLDVAASSWALSACSLLWCVCGWFELWSGSRIRDGYVTDVYGRNPSLTKGIGVRNIAISVFACAICALALAFLNVWFAAIFCALLLLIGAVFPLLFLRDIRPLIHLVAFDEHKIKARISEDVHGINEMIRFSQGEGRMHSSISRVRKLFVERQRLYRKRSVYVGLSRVMAVCAVLLATTLFLSEGMAPSSGVAAAALFFLALTTALYMAQLTAFVAFAKAKLSYNEKKF